MGNIDCKCSNPLLGADFKFGPLNIRSTRKPKEDKALRSAGADLEEPYSVDWTEARKENWRYEAITGEGSVAYKHKPEIENVAGPIGEGEEKLHDNPHLFEGIMFQSNMKEWPKDQQQYNLVKRNGSGYRFVPGDTPNFTFIQAKYLALKPLKEVNGGFKDQGTAKLSYRGQKLKLSSPGRGEGLCDVPHIKLIGHIHPNDIFQGGVGDCWLLSALSALSEFHGAVSKLFRNTPNVKDLPTDTPQKYVVTLYDLKTWEPVDIEVDERLCLKPDGHVLGCQPSYDGELWACYVEKAAAIHCGGWDELDGGQCTHAWRLLTGCKYQYTFMDDGDGFECYGKYDPNKEEWEPMENSVHKISSSIWRMDWPEVGGGGDKRTKLSHNDMFERMCAWDDQNYIMAAGTKSGSDKHDTDGIVDGHAYTVITCLNDVAGKHDLIKVRNPWGSGEFTKGRWCDDGPGWQECPEAAEVCKPVKANDGVFWVSKEEFFHYFKTVYLCAMDMNAFTQS